MKTKIRETAGVVGRTVAAKFGIGLITIVPFAATVAILAWAFVRIDGILQPLIRALWGRYVPGVGFVLTLLLILLIGVFASNVVGKKLIQYGESAIPWFPIVHQLYDGIKQIVVSFSAHRVGRQMQPVLIEFPKEGMRTIGFITNKLQHESGRKLVTVFIPTSPNPTSGFLEVVDEDQVTPAPITIEDALKTVVSAGRVTPQEVVDSLFSGT